MIIKLETKLEEDYSYFLGDYIEETIESKDPKAIKSIRKLWNNESWESIVRKFRTEGSNWYVWWFDGVRAYIRLER